MSIVCEYCGQIMGKGEGCTCSHIKFIPILPDCVTMQYADKENNDLVRSRTLILPRTRVGAVNDFFTAEQYKEQGRDRCHDCGAKVGTYHHSSCDEERCPRCGGQLLCCDCWDDFKMEVFSGYEPVEPEVNYTSGPATDSLSKPMYDLSNNKLSEKEKNEFFKPIFWETR